MKKRLIALFLLCALAFSLTACMQKEENADASASSHSEDDTTVVAWATPNAAPPETENYAVNEEIPCEQYSYEQYHTGDLELATNITGVGQWDEQHSFFLGSQILSDYETYEAILSDALAQYIHDFDRPVVYEKVQSAFQSGEITGTDFEQYDLLMIDFLDMGAIQLYPRLENLTIENGKVSVDLLYDSFSSSTSANESVLYFIPIPKGCTEAEVTPIYTSFAG